MRRHPSIRRRGGFSLFEIVIALSIVMMMIGLTAMSVRTVSRERALREVTATLKNFAKKARAQALQEQRAFQISFQPGAISIQALQKVDEADPYAQLFVTDSETVRAQDLKRFELPDDVAVELLRWGGTEWTPAAGHTWVFEQTGISEPITIRVSSPNGYVQMVFHPLTAGVADETSEIN